MSTQFQALGQSAERSSKIVTVLERRMRVAQDRFSERVTAAAEPGTSARRLQALRGHITRTLLDELRPALGLGGSKEDQ